MLTPRELQKIGAAHRLQELQIESREILKEFPELAQVAVVPVVPAAGLAYKGPRQPQPRTMPAAQRKAISDRMKAHWQKRHRDAAASTARAATRKLLKTKRKVRVKPARRRLRSRLPSAQSPAVQS